MPKEKLDIFNYVQTDSFAYQSVVFSNGKAVGIIEQPSGSCAYFEPISQQPKSIDDSLPPSKFIAVVVIAWYLRWFLLPLQASLLLLLFKFCGIVKFQNRWYGEWGLH